jgi:hypothetical protein
MIAALLLAARVAVIVTGPDPSAADVQAAIEARLSHDGAIELTGADALTVKPGPTPPLDPATKQKANDLLAKVRADYVQDKLVDALDGLATLAAIQGQNSALVPLADRVIVKVWRTAVLLAMQDKERAAFEARAALELQPDLVIDLDTFRPSLADFFDSQRPSVSKVQVAIEGLPAGAQLFVDGIPVPGTRLTLGAGTHIFEARAPGRRTATRTRDIGSDLSLPMHLALALDPASEAQARDGVAADKEPRGLAAKLKADVLVLATAGPEIHVSVWKRGGSSKGGPFTGPEPAAEWVAGALAPAPVATPTPVARVEPNGITGSSDYPVSLGWAFASRSRALADASGDRYSGSFVGSGPSVSGEGTAGPLVTAIQASWIRYTSSSVNRPDLTRSDVGGGTQIDARAGAGGRVRFGPEWNAAPQALARLDFVYQQYHAHDIHDASGALGIFPSLNRNAVELVIGGRMPMRPITAGGELGIGLWSSERERPSGTTGTSPADRLPALSWRIDAGWRIRDDMELGAAYHGEYRVIGFHGTAHAPVGTGTIEDARRRENVQSITLFLRRPFK